MSLPPPPQERGLRLSTAFRNPLSSSETAYEPLVSDTRNARPHQNAFKDRMKAADRYIHELPAYKQMKRIRLLARTISSVLNIVMFALMVFTITTFISTRHDSALGRSIWPRDPETWQTWLLLGASGFSLVVAVGMLIFFCCNYEKATHSWKLVLLLTGMEIMFWIVITTIYRTEKKRDDLWGWSCTAVAKDLQNGGGSVDFSKFCNLQVRSFPERRDDKS